MRILFLTPTSPVPTDAGNKTLTAGLLRYLAGKHECDLAALVDPSQDQARAKDALRDTFPDLGRVEVFKTLSTQRWRIAQTAALARAEHPALARFRSAELTNWLRVHPLAGSYDVVHFDMIRTAQYRRFCDGLPSVLVGSDAYSLAARRARMATPGRRVAAAALVQELLFRRYERREYPRFDVLAVVGEPDAHYLRQLCPALDVRVIGIPLPTDFQVGPIRDVPISGQRPRILVTGSLGHAGVAQGIGAFLEESSTYLSGAARGSLTVLGVNPHPSLVRLMERLPHVQHVDFVDDYAAYLRQDWVYVYPQRCGTGLQTKLQQAMAVGLPSVGYPVSFGGLRVEPDTHAFPSETREALHSAVVRLLNDPGLRRKVGEAGARHVRTCFSMEAVGDSVVGLYGQAVARHG